MARQFCVIYFFTLLKVAKFKKNLNQNIRLFFVTTVFLVPTISHAELQLKLPRDAVGTEFLFGLGAGHDETAYLGEEAVTEPSLALAILSDDFYLDFHEISYLFTTESGQKFKVFGYQDGLPNEEDIPKHFNIKSGDSYDVGLSIEEQFSVYRLGFLMAMDVTGTHDGLLSELSVGIDSLSQNTRAGVTVGVRYFDEKRSNYYFGVSKDEENIELKTYNASDNTTVFAQAIYLRNVTDNLAFVFDASISSLADSTQNSPRIKNNSSVSEIELFTGLIYQFSVLGRG